MADHGEPKGEGRAGDGDERRRGFLGFVAHEVRNPLSTALWSAELLARISAEERGGARGEKLSAMCLRSISRVRLLVEDHFLCERLDAGGVAVRRDAVPVRDAADAALERRPPDVGQVTVDVAPTVLLQADRVLLERALDALVATAGRDGSAVRIACEPAGDALALVVAGKPPDAPALEDPVKGSPSEPRGRALALPLVRRIAAALGGAFSVAEGRYVLTLPRPDVGGARQDPAAYP
ncbi:MAG TPA: HAMP domain-containing sensor histidine kinase [Anaeromyxobacter sp.]|nr:HAMP domain-containing sensor histidine kinase [Anaeromyxobacter sp.]